MIGLMTLGSRVEEVIKHHEITKTKFAKELGISQSMVSKICSGKAIPSDRTISDISRVFCVNKEWLQNGTGEMIVASKESMIALSDKQILALKAVAYGCNKNSRLKGAEYIIFADNSMDELQEISFHEALTIVHEIIGFVDGGADNGL